MPRTAAVDRTGFHAWHAYRAVVDAEAAPVQMAVFRFEPEGRGRRSLWIQGGPTTGVRIGAVHTLNAATRRPGPGERLGRERGDGVHDDGRDRSRQPAQLPVRGQPQCLALGRARHHPAGERGMGADQRRHRILRHDHRLRRRREAGGLRRRSARTRGRSGGAAGHREAGGCQERRGGSGRREVRDVDPEAGGRADEHPARHRRAGLRHAAVGHVRRRPHPRSAGQSQADGHLDDRRGLRGDRQGGRHGDQRSHGEPFGARFTYCCRPYPHR